MCRAVQLTKGNMGRSFRNPIFFHFPTKLLPIGLPRPTNTDSKVLLHVHKDFIMNHSNFLESKFVQDSSSSS